MFFRVDALGGEAVREERGEFVEPADEGGVNVAEGNLHPGVLEGAFVGAAAVRIGGVVSVTAQPDGDQGGDGIVGGLHEMRRLQGGVVHALDRFQEVFGIVNAPEVRADNDGIRDVDPGLPQRFGRGPDCPFEQPAHPTGFHHREHAPPVRFRIAGQEFTTGMEIDLTHGKAGWMNRFRRNRRHCTGHVPGVPLPRRKGGYRLDRPPANSTAAG